MNTVEKMTKKETYEMIIDLVSNLDTEDADRAIEFCHKEIDALDRKAEKAKEAAAKKKAEADELLEAVYEVLSADEFETIASVVAKFDDETITIGKVQYRLAALLKEGRAEKDTITIPATETTKARKVVAYRRINLD